MGDHHQLKRLCVSLHSEDVAIFDDIAKAIRERFNDPAITKATAMRWALRFVRDHIHLIQEEDLRAVAFRRGPKPGTIKRKKSTWREKLTAKPTPQPKPPPRPITHEPEDRIPEEAAYRCYDCGRVFSDDEAYFSHRPCT